MKQLSINRFTPSLIFAENWDCKSCVDKHEEQHSKSISNATTHINSQRNLEFGRTYLVIKPM